MAQVRNTLTGMTLDIPDENVGAMSSQWERVGTSPQAQAAPAQGLDLSRIGAASQPKVQELPGIGVVTTYPKAVVPQAQAEAPDTTAGLMARTGVQAVPEATPPAGATYVTNPQELSGLTESQIWRQPGTNRIYRLAQQAAAPVTSAVPQAQATKESVTGGYRLNFYRDPTQAETDWWSTRPQSEFDAFMKSEVEKWKPTAPKPTPAYPSPDYSSVTGTQAEQLKQAYNFYDTQLKSLEAMIQQGYTPTAEEKALAAEFQAKREELRSFDLATLQRTEAMVGEGRGRTVANVQLAQDKERRIRALERLGLAQEAETLSERLSGAKEERTGLLGMATALFDVSTKRFDAALGLTKELAAIDKQSRDDARTWLLDMVDWASGLTWDELDPASQQRITETVANTPLTLDMVKQALKTAKDKMYAGSSDLNELLSATDAAALGVPYGTTKGQAAALGIMPAGNLTTAQSTMLENVTTRYQADSVVNTARTMGINVEIADAVLKNPSAGPEQIAALYTFIKTLDPTSAVREGEIGLATETQSFFSQWATAIERLAQGKVLDANTVSGLAQASKSIAQMWIEAGNRRTQQYVAQATALGVGDPFGRYLGAMSGTAGDGGTGGSLSGLTPEETEYVSDGLGVNATFSADMTPQQAIAAAAPLLSGLSAGATGTLIDVTRALGISDESYVGMVQSLGSDPQKVWEWVKSQFPKSDASAQGTRSGGSASWRNNNPLNIKYGNFASGYGATRGSAATDGGNFANFPDEATGLRAARDLLRSQSYSSLTLEQAMRRWSGNGYGADVAPADLRGKKTGSMTDAELDRLIEAMRVREGWTEGVYLS